MNMVSLGIDVSTRKIAVAALPEPGKTFTLDAPLRHDALDIPTGLAGARRLNQIRMRTYSHISRMYQHAAVIVIEIPWARADSSFALLSAAGVVMEAAQAAVVGAVVKEVPTPTWKAHSVGHGGANKSQVMDYARTLGYDGDDQDIADALAMAAAGWDFWRRDVDRAEAA
jgi:Holliday junction resolvasome RuvABC endonuclease subunit